jgi:cytochrome c oxidase subunit IV
VNDFVAPETATMAVRSVRSPSDAYNDHEPLRVDVGSRIVEILQITSEPKTRPVPQITVDGTSLNIGPSLIDKHHKITINLLVDGAMHFLTHLSPLIDVEVLQPDEERRERRWFAYASMAIIAALVVTSFAIIYLGPSNINRLTTVLEIVFVPVVALVTVAVAYYYRNPGGQ